MGFLSGLKKSKPLGTAPTGRSSAPTGRGRSSGHANSAHQQAPIGAPAPPTDADRQAFGSSISNEQWSSVLNLFRTLAPSSSSQSDDNGNGICLLPWILDTGTSFHMTG